MLQESALIATPRQIARLAARLRLERQAESALRSLAAYSRLMWSEIEPGTPLVWNWHLDLICSELERVTAGETRELVICVPPGSMKSILVSVFWPTWQWLQKPWLRSLHVANSDRLGVRDSRRARDIVQSERYQMLRLKARDILDAPLWGLSADQAEKVHFATTEGGSRLALPTHARITGDRADALVVDDPIDAQEAVIGSPDQVARRMEEVQHRYDHVWASRLNDPQNNPRVTIMQRLAPGDLAGVLLDRGVRSVVLPMEYEPDHPFVYTGDPRTERGELLFPERFGREYVEKLKTTPGASRHYQAQYQQLPTPLGGGVFRLDWLRYYRDRGEYYEALDASGQPRASIRQGECWRLMVADTALSSRSLADYTVIQIWDIVRSSRDMFLVHQWRKQADAPEVEDELLLLAEQYKPSLIGIEESTASLAILQRLRRDGLILRGFRPKDFGGDKVARAYSASILMEHGHIHLPVGSPILQELEPELASFPGGRNDDQVDAMAYAAHFAADRDMWMPDKPKPLPANAIGRILGHDKLLYGDNDTDSAFALDGKA